MTEETTEYPLATDQLIKGSRVERAEICRAFSVEPDTKAFRLALMRARHYIEGRFLDRGEVVTITEDNGSLMILTDAEAAVFNDDAVWRYVKRAARSLVRQRAVDRAQLTPAQVSVHDRALEVNGRALAATYQEKNHGTLLRVQPRSTPLPILPVDPEEKPDAESDTAP